MYIQILLVISLLLSTVLAIPLYASLLNNEEKKPAENLTEKNPLELGNALNNGIKERPTPAGRAHQSNDLIGQETFYPVGGVWWGHRPWGGWGGWGGYRPWHGWHGWHGWNRPHWGGNWGRPWGGPWGGGVWGQTKS